MKTITTFAALLLLILPGCDQTGTDDNAPPDYLALLEINERISTSLMLEQDGSYLLSISDESFFVVAPGGVVETRDQLIEDLWSFSTVEAIEVQNARVIPAGSTAVVLNRLVIHGPIQGPIGEIGPITVMTVFDRSRENRWMVVSRAYSTCDPQAVDFGLC